MNVAVAVILTVGMTGAALDPFDRYQIILDRKPFGEVVPPSAPAAASPSSSQPPLASVLRLTMLEYDEASGAVKAGIVDTKANRRYFLSVGQSEEGVTIVNADFERDQVLVRKDGQEAWLTLGAGPKPRDAGSGVVSRLPPAPTNVARRVMIRTDASGATTVTELPAGQSLVTNPPPRPWTTREEMREFYRKKNLELIRAGGRLGPPLPIRLTPEEDAMLVAEGVLPPLEEASEQPAPQTPTPKANEIPRRR